MIFLIIKNYIYKYKFYISFTVIVLIAIFLVTNNKVKNVDSPVIVDALEKEEKVLGDDNELETYSVDIKGAVKKPGVYRVVKGSNVNDVIQLAGGLKSTATTININLSKKVSDEMVIYIYTKSEYNQSSKSVSTTSINSSNFECKSNTVDADISSCITNKDNTIIYSTTTSDDDNNFNHLESKENLININSATKEELLTLTGIGESKADCIITYRQENGGFNSIDEIKNVSGIGEALFDKIKNNITV